MDAITAVQNRKTSSFVFLCFLLLVYLGFNVFLVQTVYIHHDEGWYLYASQLVYQGKLPYLDFAYFQSPLLPYVYGLIQCLTGPSVLAGRLTSLAFSVGVAGLVVLVARRLGGNLAAVVALLCLTSSADFVRVGSYANNVILGTFLAMLGTAWLLGDWSRRSVQALSTACWSLAVLARVSFAPALALVAGFILWHHRRHLKAAVPAIVTPAILLLTGLGGLALVSFDRFYFDIVAAQMNRRHQLDWGLNPATGVSNLELILVSALLYASAMIIIFTLGLIYLWQSSHCRSQRSTRASQNQHLIWLVGLLIPVVYLPNVLPGDLYPTYLASPYPFACIVAGWLVAKKWAKRLPPLSLVGITGLAIALSIITSGLYLSVIVSWQNPGLNQLQELSTYIESISGPDSQLFTFETTLAANSGRAVAPGTAMSYFSYFPKFSIQRAAHYRVINDEMVSDQLAHRQADLVLLTDFDVHLFRQPANPSHLEPVALTQSQLFDLFPELQGQYELAKTITDYGEWHNHLYIFIPAHEKPK